MAPVAFKVTAMKGTSGNRKSYSLGRSVTLSQGEAYTFLIYKLSKQPGHSTVELGIEPGVMVQLGGLLGDVYHALKEGIARFANLYMKWNTLQ